MTAKGSPSMATPGDKGCASFPNRDGQSAPYRKLFRWGWYIVSVALGWFVLNTALGIFVTVLTQYNQQVVVVTLNKLQNPTKIEETAAVTEPKGSLENPEGRGKPEKEQNDFLSRFLPSDVRSAAILFAVLSALLIGLQMLDRVLTVKTDNMMTARLQQRLHDKLLTLGPSYHSRHDIGETMMIVTQYAAGTQMLLRDLISSPISLGATMISALMLLQYNINQIGATSPGIQACLMGALIILPVGGWFLSKKLQAAFTEVRNSQVAMANEFSNSASLPLEVQLMGAEQQRSKAFAEKVNDLIRKRVGAAIRGEASNQFQTAIPLALQVGFVLYGVFVMLESGTAKPGAIYGMYTFVPLVCGPMLSLISFFTGLRTAWPQVEKVVEILEAQPDIIEQDGAASLEPGRLAIVLKDVTFFYVRGGEKILDNLSQTFSPGSVTAIVGRSGSGKSSLLNLAARLCDPQDGAVYIDDTDIRQIGLKSLRKNIVMVSQFPLYLVDTIRANFTLAKADATDKEIEAVCSRNPLLWEELQKHVPQGAGPLDYILPKSGGLSGGYRRLLAVTRALLLQPAILLLDEPTTGIDNMTRQALKHILRNASKGITVLLVDHDMTFVSQVADTVCCLEDGKFSDIGAPDELLKKPSLFQRLIEAGRKIASLEPVRIEKAVKDKLDFADMGVAVAGTAEFADVTGQAMAPNAVTCPWCEKECLLPEPADRHSWYVCGKCGNAFTFPKLDAVAHEAEPDVTGQTLAFKKTYYVCSMCGQTNRLNRQGEIFSPERCAHCGMIYTEEST